MKSLLCLFPAGAGFGPLLMARGAGTGRPRSTPLVGAALTSSALFTLAAPAGRRPGRCP